MAIISHVTTKGGAELVSKARKQGNGWARQGTKILYRQTEVQDQISLAFITLCKGSFTSDVGQSEAMNTLSKSRCINWHIRMCGGLYEYLNNRINFV